MNNKMQECILAHNGQLCYAIASNTSKENRCQLIYIRNNSIYIDEDWWGNTFELNPQNESHIKAKEFFFTRVKHIIEEKELELGVIKAKLLEVSKDISPLIAQDINKFLETTTPADEPTQKAGEEE